MRTDAFLPTGGRKHIKEEARLSEKRYVVYLSPERKDRFRYYHVLESGKIVRFSIQYEALFGREWRPIARYDTAHGQPHRDLLHPDGNQEKRKFRGYTQTIRVINQIPRLGGVGVGETLSGHPLLL